MIELFLIYRLCRGIGRILREKGRSAGWYQLLAVALWIGGEIGGAVIGILLGMEGGAYALSLLGAAAGAGASYAIARHAAAGVLPAAGVAQVFD